MGLQCAQDLHENLLCVGDAASQLNRIDYFGMKHAVLLLDPSECCTTVTNPVAIPSPLSQGRADLLEATGIAYFWSDTQLLELRYNSLQLCQQEFTPCNISGLVAIGFSSSHVILNDMLILDLRTDCHQHTRQVCRETI